MNKVGAQGVEHDLVEVVEWATSDRGVGGGPPGRGGGRGGLNRDNRSDNRGGPTGRGGFGPRR